MTGMRNWKSIGLAVLMAGATVSAAAVHRADARTDNNWASASRSQECSREAERYADRNARRQTATNAAIGGAIGGIAGGSGRSAGRGALIGGGVGLYQANTRWRTYYNRRYNACINR